MTLLHLVVDVPDTIDPRVTDPAMFARAGLPVPSALLSATWDLAQVPPPVEACTGGQLLIRSVAILAEGGDSDSGCGFLLPGPFGIFALAAHYRTRPPRRYGIATEYPPDEYDHATFQGRLDGGYTFIAKPTLADTAVKLGEMLEEAAGA